MKWLVFVVGLGLLFVFEGILPFLSPYYWRQMMQRIFIQSDRAIRIMGLVSMLIGLILVMIAHYFY